MRGIFISWIFSAVIRVTFITECLLTCVKGDGPEQETDIRYAMIGIGLGLFLVALFFITKICIIKKQVCENPTDFTSKRPSAPNLIPLNHPDQSEIAMEAVSTDKRC